MTKSVIIATCFFLLFSNINTNITVKNGVIKGSIYDSNSAVILNIPVLVENMLTGESRILKTDSDGIYSIDVPPGRYKVKLISVAGYPIGEDRASFSVSSGETIVINFRPTPVAIASYLENGNYVSRYDGSFPASMTYFVPQTTGLTVKDLRIWFRGPVAYDKELFKYKMATASYDNFTIHSQQIIYDRFNGKLIAEGKVLFEDGHSTRFVKKVTIDLTKSTAFLEN